MGKKGPLPYELHEVDEILKEVIEDEGGLENVVVSTIDMAGTSEGESRWLHGFVISDGEFLALEGIYTHKRITFKITPSGEEFYRFNIILKEERL